MSGDVEWNLVRWDPERVDRDKGHLESFFVKLNDPASARALWVKLTIFAPTEKTSGGPPFERGRTVAEAWAIAFDHAAEEEPPSSYRERASISAPHARHVAVKRTVPIEEATLARTPPVMVRVAGVTFDGRSIVGEIEHGAARIAFDLKIQPIDASPLVPLPHPKLYRAPFPTTKLVSPIVDARAEGIVRIDAPSGKREWEVSQWPAMQGHNWGSRHADTYAWAHCNCWHEPEGRDVVFEGFSAKARIGKHLTTPLVTMLAVRHRGVRYEATATREILSARGSLEGLRRWKFSGKQAGAVIEGVIALREDDVVGLYYPNPDGEMTYCLNSKLARATLRFAPHDRPPLVLTSDAAALEIGTHEAHHGYRMYV